MKGLIILTKIALLSVFLASCFPQSVENDKCLSELFGRKVEIEFCEEFLAEPLNLTSQFYITNKPILKGDFVLFMNDELGEYPENFLKRNKIKFCDSSYVVSDSKRYLKVQNGELLLRFIDWINSQCKSEKELLVLYGIPLEREINCVFKNKKKEGSFLSKEDLENHSYLKTSRLLILKKVLYENNQEF